MGTTRAGFNTNLLANLDIPLPPIAEQERIVDIVQQRLSSIDAAENAVIANLSRVNRLRQSILKCAFEGKLVPQDLTEEPASLLLKRIRNERATSSGTARQPRGSTRIKAANPTLQVPLPI